jgi:hypothetical protein
MLHLYVFSLLAGLVGANGVPHFVKGIVGQKHQTPFGKPSSAIINVLWGWLNFLIAVLLLYWAHTHNHRLRALALVAFGALITSLVLAYTWSKYPEHNE